MPAPTPFKAIDLDQPGIKALPKAKTKDLTFNEKQLLRQFVGKALNPNLDVQPAPVRKYSKEELKGDVQRLGQRVVDYLKEGNRLEQRLEFASLKDINVILGILTDKMLLLEGQPTQIIGHAQQAKMDQVSEKLNDLIKQRGLGQKVTLTERTAVIESKG